MNNIGLNANRTLLFKANQEVDNQQPLQNTVHENQELPPVELPDIYQHSLDTPKTSKLETFKKFDVMNLIAPWFEHPLLMLGTCAGLSYGVDKFSAACGGEYEKSLVGKAAKLGDKIENSKFITSKPIQGTINFFKKCGNYIKTKAKNSDLLQAIFKTPSQPEWRIVKDESLNMQQRVAQDFYQVTQKLKLTQEGSVKLSDLYIKEGEKSFLQKLFGASKATEEMASNAIQLKRIGVPDNEILNIIKQSDATKVVKAKQLEKLGLSADFIKKLEKQPATRHDIKKILEACERAKDIKIGEGHHSVLGKFQIFERKIGFDEIGNRLKSMAKLDGSSKTGRALATFLQKCHRGFTFGGGKFGVLLFVSPMLVETIMNVKKAENDQKVGTAVQGLVSAVSWVFTFPLALSLMHHVAGAQYAGMSQLNVAKYRKLITDFNANVDKGVYKNKASYKEALKKLKSELQALKGNKPQNLLTKICKKLTGFMTMDLETIKPYKGTNAIANTVRKIPNFLKNVGGVPMRFIIWAAITMGVLDAIINKGVKLCFGNYYDAIKEEEHLENKKAQKEFLKQDLRERLMETQREKIYGVPNSENTNIDTNIANEIAAAESLKQNSVENRTAPAEAPAEAQVNHAETQDNHAEAYNPDNTETQSVNKNVQQRDSYTYIPKQASTITNEENTAKRDNYTYIPSSENVIKKDSKNSDQLKYIPSQIGAKFNKTYDNSGLEKALQRADRAEAQAIRILNGNFSSL